jgi:hypothetical protein
MYKQIYNLSKLFSKLAIRAIQYNPVLHQELKRDEEATDPEERIGEAKEYGETKKFDQRYFEMLKDPAYMRLYAHRRLQMIGQGSSRAVYIYSPKFALKIATNMAGIAQNKLEISISEDGEYNSIIAKVVKYDYKNYNWLISELVYPIDIRDELGYPMELEEKEEFKKHSPIAFDSLMHGINKKYNPDIEYEGGEFEPYESAKQKIPPQIQTEMDTKIQLAKKLIDDYGILFTDIAIPSNWGRTADGRTVILDFGFDDIIHKQYYGANRDKAKSWRVDPYDYGNYFPHIDDTIKENPNRPKDED